jgi:4'-phosphopantetheinyl transferase
MPTAATSSLLAYPLELRREEAELPGAVGFSFCPAAAPAVALLHPGEERLWREFRYPLRQLNFLLGRAAAKMALARCFPAVPSGAIEIAPGVFGQPLVRASRLEAEVSIAHSRGAAVAVACLVGHPIGVDLEWVDASREETVRACVTPREQALWDGTSLAPLQAAFLSWSAREALAKALRCGLTVPFELLELAEITVAEGRVSARFPNFPQYAVRSWLAGGYALSIVAPRRSEIGFNPPAEACAGLEAAAALPAGGALSGTLSGSGTAKAAP